MMPGLRGDELARRPCLHHPDLKVLYLTGFAERLFTLRPTLWENEVLVEKPFTPTELLQAVSSALSGRVPGGRRLRRGLRSRTC
jgi:two-component system, cell cycle sensor histidine kinase and response regulator CckA